MNAPADRLLAVLFKLAAARCRSQERLARELSRQQGVDGALSSLIRLSAAQCRVSPRRFVAAVVEALSELRP